MGSSSSETESTRRPTTNGGEAPPLGLDAPNQFSSNISPSTCKPEDLSIFSVDAIKHGGEIAGRLAHVIEERKLYAKINGRRHVTVEGWTLLAAMVGLACREESIVANDDGSYEAIVIVVRQADGAVVGRGSSICGVDERTWKKRPRYARRSMASTRACVRACRLCLSWIIQLAGYETTPAEEMPDVDASPSSKTTRITIGSNAHSESNDAPADTDDAQRIRELRERAKLSRNDLEKLAAEMDLDLGRLTVGGVSLLAARLELAIAEGEVPF